MRLVQAVQCFRSFLIFSLLTNCQLLLRIKSQSFISFGKFLLFNDLQFFSGFNPGSHFFLYVYKRSIELKNIVTFQNELLSVLRGEFNEYLSSTERTLCSSYVNIVSVFVFMTDAFISNSHLFTWSHCETLFNELVCFRKKNFPLYEIQIKKMFQINKFAQIQLFHLILCLMWHSIKNKTFQQLNLSC